MIIAAVAVTFVACNKEGNETAHENIESNEDFGSAKTRAVTALDVQPHFLYRHNISYGSCSSKPDNHLCGFDITALTGDEACWLMMQAGDPFAFILPTAYLTSNNASQLIDSARTGAMTFNSDCTFLSGSLVKTTGVSSIPAGRYSTTMTVYDGDSAVYIYFDTVL